MPSTDPVVSRRRSELSSLPLTPVTLSGAGRILVTVFFGQCHTTGRYVSSASAVRFCVRRTPLTTRNRPAFSLAPVRFDISNYNACRRLLSTLRRALPMSLRPSARTPVALCFSVSGIGSDYTFHGERCHGSESTTVNSRSLPPTKCSPFFPAILYLEALHLLLSRALALPLPRQLTTFLGASSHSGICPLLYWKKWRVLGKTHWLPIRRFI